MSKEEEIVGASDWRNCPFCGSEPRIVKIRSGYDNTDSTLHANCSRCFARTPAVSCQAHASGIGYFDISDKAIVVLDRMWNRTQDYLAGKP